MKRTLTAAATLVVSSAGAVGFAGTAAAAEQSSLPAELPVDNNLAQTAFHAAGTLHSAKGVVGDVVPMGESGEPGAPPAEQNTLPAPLGDLATGLGVDPSALGALRPVGSTLPAQPRTGSTEGNGDPLSNIIGGVLNSQGLGPGEPGGSPLQGLSGPPPGGSPLGDYAHAVPQQTKSVERAGAPEASGEVLRDTVETLLDHGPLGATTNLGSP